jgi:endonuclease/exonuclease/phosphatase family metal-dependent hydrolase
MRIALLFIPSLIACASVKTKPELAFHHSPDARQGSFRAMTFNIQRGKQGLERVSAAIREGDPDIVALQEVDVGTTRCGQIDQLRELAQKTGFEHWVFFSSRTTDGGEFGNALLSHHPIVFSQKTVLPNDEGHEARSVGRALIRVENRLLSVYVTHLSHLPGLTTLRERQMRRILRLMGEDTRPKLLMGDLNDTRQAGALVLASRVLRDVFATHGHGSPTTFPLPFGFLPGPRFDYVLASREWVPRHSHVLRRHASDHFPLIADLSLPRTLEEPATLTASRTE